MTRLRILLALLFCLLPLPSLAQEGEFVARKLVALYDSRFELNLRSNTIHRFFGLPANRLGYDILFHDINAPLPELGEEVHGILIWFHHDPVPQLEAYIDWLAENVSKGKKLVVMENFGIGRADRLDADRHSKLQYVFSRIGMRDLGEWHPLTHNTRIISANPAMIGFERKVTPPYPAYGEIIAANGGVSHLRLSPGDGQPGAYADVVITGPQGGFVSSGYAYSENDIEDRTVSQWLINPFLFLSEALQPPLYPVPDVTTRNGRRIFYSQIDGDGWNSPTLIERYRKQYLSSADVVSREIFEQYPDFAFSMGVVAGDMADDCFGSEKSRKSARHILALPNVEATSHTYTHPLFWEFFEDYTPEKEAPFARHYPKPAGLFRQNFSALWAESPVDKKAHLHDSTATQSVTEMKKMEPIADRQAMMMETMLETYDIPRSYNCVPFDDHNEVTGANRVIESLAPEGTKVRLLQWSGNTSPYERFLKTVREAGMLNINGGEGRYDAEYPSYSTLYPIGILIGDERQIYSTASNENTYTNLWSERFFGYRYLIETVRHTEHPIRVAPFNVYFHSYSGERPGSVRALREIMNYARKQEVLPIFTSHFAAIANGFFSTRVERIAPSHWRVHDRGEMQTLRIPAKAGKAVDISRSTGVLGQRILLDSLYIFLNPSIDKPEIILIEGGSEARAAPISLQSTRWNILSAERLGTTDIELVAQGFGEGEWTWNVPEDGTYHIEATTRNAASPDGATASFIVNSHNGLLHFVLTNVSGLHPVKIRIMRQGARE